MALNEATVILPRHVGGRDDGQAEKRRAEARYQEQLRVNAELRDRLRLIEEGLQAINSRVDAKRETLTLKK
jgi:hypothetical protein